MTSPTTPRDAIGLSERLRERVRILGQSPDSILKFMDRILPLIEEAATALDALQGEISQWANEVARYKAYAEKFDEENAALQARVKELDASNRTANKWQQWAEDERAKYESRATRAEQQRDKAKAEERESFQKYVDANEARIEAVQQRDEALERLKPLSEVVLPWGNVGSGMVSADAVLAARDLVRRLAAGTGDF